MNRLMLKSLLGMGVAGMLGSGSALAADRDDTDQTPQTTRIEAAQGQDPSMRSIRERRHSAPSQINRSVDPKGLDLGRAHFSATQMLHVSNPEGESDTHSGKAATGTVNRSSVAVQDSPTFASGYAYARTSALTPDQFMGADRSSRSPGVAEHSGPSDTGDDDMSSSTGDKQLSGLAQKAKNTVIPNDFGSARTQLEKQQKMGLDKAQAPHFSAGTAQQLSGGDSGENGTASSMKRVNTTPRDPQMGAHNNFRAERERASATSVVDRIAQVHVPEKMYH